MNKQMIFTMAIAFFSLNAFSQKVTITVSVNDLRSNEGVILIRLLDDKEKQVQQQIAVIKEGTMEVYFKNVTAGKYAISYFHDENNNQEMDTGTMGIPKEGYGFSNDARGFMGPPSFKEQVFEVSRDTSMTLKTKYW